MFEDLIMSRPVHPGRERARALPASLLFHGLAVGAAIALPALTTELPPVQAGMIPDVVYVPRVPVVAVASPPPPTLAPRRPPTAHPHTARSEAPLPVPSGGTGVAVPHDIGNATGDPLAGDDGPLCFANCTGGDPEGAILPGLPEGDDVADPPLLRAGRDVTPPAKLSGNPPIYPPLGRQARVEGDVVIECTIDPSGRVVNATVTRSIPLLDEAALTAVQGWRYRPTLVDGVPVPVLMTVTVRFRIR
jgi:protein TonB